MPPRPCLHPGCPRLGTGTYCPVHVAARNHAKLARRRASGTGATQRLRRQLNRQGFGSCGLCHEVYPAHLLEVDHRQPLEAGGMDTEENLWPLCRGCHRVKTAAEARGRAGRKFGR